MSLLKRIHLVHRCIGSGPACSRCVTYQGIEGRPWSSWSAAPSCPRPSPCPCRRRRRPCLYESRAKEAVKQWTMRYRLRQSLPRPDDNGRSLCFCFPLEFKSKLCATVVLTFSFSRHLQIQMGAVSLFLFSAFATNGIIRRGGERKRHVS